MLRQAILLEVRKQIGPFLSLLLLILLSVVTVMVVTYVSTGYVMSQTLEISCTFTIIAGSLLLPFYLGGSWGASLKREPIASIEEVLPVSSRIRKVASRDALPALRPVNHFPLFLPDKQRMEWYCAINTLSVLIVYRDWFCN
jgi:hypothetical protein